jgi:enoyl-CoA hydratase
MRTRAWNEGWGDVTVHQVYPDHRLGTIPENIETATLIERTRRGTTAVLRMTHGKANALDTEFLRALRASIASVAASDARALVLTGEGTIFSAGVDLVRLLEGDRDYLGDFLPELSACFRALFEFEKPAVAAVNGHAIAGGCILACACDRRIMTRGNGRIGVPELRVGVPFPLVPLEIIRFALPPHRAQEVLLVGRNYSPDQALEMGLVDELVESEHLLDRAVAAAEDLASIPFASYARAKRDFRRPTVETWERHAASHDRQTLEAWGGASVRGAVDDYVERTLRKRV